MKKIMLIAVIAVLLAGCGNSRERKRAAADAKQAAEQMTDAGIHNARNSIDYAGTYHGVLPSASGGVNTTITLQDGQFTRTTFFNDHPDAVRTEAGEYSWRDGSTIVLEGAIEPNSYFVAEGRIFALDMEGNRVTGEFAEEHALNKKPD